MAAHFPFSGNADRVSVYAFFERHGLDLKLQERYYRWWFDWAKEQVAKDPGLAAAKGPQFQRFPYGQHAFHDFHLHQYSWSTALTDLGGFIDGTLLPRLGEVELHELEHKHRVLLDELKQQAQRQPRPEAPEIGRYRHT